jgi:hypothetical protein
MSVPNLDNNTRQSGDQKKPDLIDKVILLTEQLLKLRDLLIEEIPEVQRELAKYGWYMSEGATVNETFQIAIDARKGQIDNVHNALIKFYRKQLPMISHSLITKYPDRAKILREALKAHKLKMFHASTSLFLSQADGICSGDLFKTAKNKKQIRNLLRDKKIPVHLEIFLSAITAEAVIDKPHPKTKNVNDSLNRNAVLHGYDTAYGSEINSLKALSLLCFVGTFLHPDILKKREKST